MFYSCLRRHFHAEAAGCYGAHNQDFIAQGFEWILRTVELLPVLIKNLYMKGHKLRFLNQLENFEQRINRKHAFASFSSLHLPATFSRCFYFTSLFCSVALHPLDVCIIICQGNLFFFLSNANVSCIDLGGAVFNLPLIS